MVYFNCSTLSVICNTYTTHYVITLSFEIKRKSNNGNSINIAFAIIFYSNKVISVHSIVIKILSYIIFWVYNWFNSKGSLKGISHACIIFIIHLFTISSFSMAVVPFTEKYIPSHWVQQYFLINAVTKLA